jgi:predicted lipoprotein with Yx(FWY)xxD motif
MRSNLIGLALIGAFALAACGGGTSGSSTPMVVPTATPTTNPNPTATPASDPTLPKQVSVSGQEIWETQGGLPLYEYSGDTAGAGVSNCTGGCATVWPPLMSGATSKSVGAFTIITRTNPSGSQWAYTGKPLYTFESDTAGQPPTGNGVQGFSTALVSGQTGASTPPPGCTGPYC